MTPLSSSSSTPCHPGSRCKHLKQLLQLLLLLLLLLLHSMWCLSSSSSSTAALGPICDPSSRQQQQQAWTGTAVVAWSGTRQCLLVPPLQQQHLAAARAAARAAAAACQWVQAILLQHLLLAVAVAVAQLLLRCHPQATWCRLHLDLQPPALAQCCLGCYRLQQCLALWAAGLAT
jgi:hypothetical protein